MRIAGQIARGWRGHIFRTTVRTSSPPASNTVPRAYLTLTLLAVSTGSSTIAILLLPQSSVPVSRSYRELLATGSSRSYQLVDTGSYY